MKSIRLEYGDDFMDVEVPESASVIRYGDSYFEPPEVDPYEATRKALANPLGIDPIHKLVKKGSKVAIAFPDRVKGGSHEKAHRKVSIPIIVEELKKAGVEERDIKLICAIGLHKKNTKEEFLSYLGEEIVNAFWPDRLVNHDAEDPDGIVQLGEDEMGNSVCVNKDIYDADLAIMIGHVQGNPYGGYSGGYKMCVTGVTDWNSIRSHHTPKVMHRPDFVPVNAGESMMRRKFDSIGRAMERGMGKRFFTVDAVLGDNAKVLGVFAGTPDEVQKASWPLAERWTDVHLDINEKFDVMVFGMPRSFHYGPGMGTNPILMMQACGSQITRHKEVMNEGCVLIATSVCDGWFNDEWFPSYRELYEKIQDTHELTDVVQFEEEMSTRADYIHKYRFEYGYHPFHAFSMVSMAGVARKYTQAIYLASAKEPKYARGMGAIPTKTFDDALKQAEKYVGKNPRILVIPEAFTRTAVHMRI